jgi:tetratricopeptide (TPR) repeat protein
MNDASLIGFNGKEVRRGLCWWTFLCLLIGLLAIGLGEAIAAAPAGQPRNENMPMSYAEARSALIQLWETQRQVYSEEQYDQLRVTFIGKDKIELHIRKTWTTTGRAYYHKYRYDLASMSDPYIREPDFWHRFKGVKVAVDRGASLETSTELLKAETQWLLRSDAEAFSNVLYMLKQYAVKERTKLASDASSFADFQGKAKAWRALKVKPELPPEVRRYRLLAEDAIKHKEFEKAVQYYEQGLEIEPLWPQGQYNAALLYGEMKEYRDAELHMKRYLELVPDAPDAQAARDQMMIWQSRMAP